VAGITTLIVATVLGSACTTVTAPPTGELQSNNNAFLKGMESSGFSLGSTFNVQVKSVDGKSAWNSWSGYSSGLAVPAGQHHLILMCSMVAEMGNIRTQPVETELDVNLVSGHVYQMQPGGRSQGGGCGVTVIDTAALTKTGP